MASLEDDHYAILDLTPDATPAQIGKAFRKRSLLFHPDKVGAHNTAAAEQFHRLSVAVETLSDPARRAAYDALYTARAAQKRKLAAMDAGLRQARQDLETRERAAKRAHTDQFAADVARSNEIDRLREDGMRKAQAAEQQRRQMSGAKVDIALKEARRRAVQEAASVTDCTLRVRWKRKEVVFGEQELRELFEQYGAVERVAMNSKGKGSAMVVYESVFDAQSAITDHLARHFRDLQLSWAGGAEPLSLSAPYNSPGTSTAACQNANPDPPAPATSTNPSAAAYDEDYELITLMKMRQAAAEKSGLAT